jgi:hypothetical protein
MPPLIHMTIAYSNAMLVAILPHISDCAKQLDMPILQPVTIDHVARFNASPFKDAIGGGLWLTNQYWFVFNNGFVRGFRCPDDYYTMADENWDHLERYVGIDNMTTNEAIQLARDAFRKLGYKPADFGVDGPPTYSLGPSDNKRLGHIPYCRVEWNSPKPASQEEFNRGYNIQFDISLQQKRIVGMSLISKRFFRPDPKIDVVAELESDYQQRNQMHMFIRTNAPSHWHPDQTTNSHPATSLPAGQEMKQE